MSFNLKSVDPYRIFFYFSNYIEKWLSTESKKINGKVRRTLPP